MGRGGDRCPLNVPGMCHRPLTQRVCRPKAEEERWLPLLDLNQRHPDTQNGGFTLLIADRLGGLVCCGRGLGDLEGVARAKCQECARGGQQLSSLSIKV